MPFPGIPFWEVRAKISALPSTSFSMNLGMDCSEVTETRMSPSYRIRCSSSWLSSHQLPSPTDRMAQHKQKQLGKKVKAEGEQGRGRSPCWPQQHLVLYSPKRLPRTCPKNGQKTENWLAAFFRLNSSSALERIKTKCFSTSSTVLGPSITILQPCCNHAQFSPELTVVKILQGQEKSYYSQSNRHEVIEQPLVLLHVIHNDTRDYKKNEISEIQA